jgi:hypothetical protein
MNSCNKFVAEIPTDRRVEGIYWLVLEEDLDHTGGWYLYGHRSLDEGSEFDSWYLTISEAQQEALHRWGVTSSAWKPTS